MKFSLAIEQYDDRVAGRTKSGFHVLIVGEFGDPMQRLSQMPQLVPEARLLEKFETTAMCSSEFMRRYRDNLRTCHHDLETLWGIACATGLVILHGKRPWQAVAARALADGITQIECKRRWDAGWIVGGYTYPLRDFILRLGGLHYARHKVWVMPDKAAWRLVLAEMPGDF